VRETDEVAKAFSMGADARLAGLDWRSMSLKMRGQLRRAWIDGWQDVDWRWGEAVMGRWRYALLPEIRAEMH